MKQSSLFIASFFLILSVVYGKEGWWHLTTDDGLNSNRILSIHQTKSQDIWIGTDKGITRYNGVFDEKSLLKLEESSLLGKDSNTIIELPSGQILARGVGGGGTVNINFFNGLEWDRSDFFQDKNIWVSLWPEFYVNSGKELWISTWSDGVVKFDGRKWELYDLDFTSLKSSEKVQKSDLEQLPKGPKNFDQLIKSVNCACGTCSRLTVYACGCKFAKKIESGFEEEFALGKTVEQIRAEYLAENGSQFSTYGKVNWLVQTPDDRIWTETSDTNDQTIIASFDGQKWTAEFNTNNSTLDITKTVFSTSTGKILLGTDKGLFQYDTVFNTFTDLQIGQANISQIYESTEQILWVGTEKGLFKLNNGNWEREFNGLSINAIEQSKQGILRVGTSNGLFQFRNGKWISELAGIGVNCFAELSDGTLLVGGNGGLWVKPPPDEIASTQTMLPGTLIGGLFLASDGVLWCRSMAGIFSYNGLEWTNHGYSKPESATYLRNFFRYTNIYEDTSGTIWFSDDNGLLSYKTDTLEFHSLNSWTWGFLELSNGDIWALGQVGPHTYNGKSWSFPSGLDRSDAYVPNYSAYQNDDDSVWVIGDMTSGVWLYDNGRWIEGLNSESNSMIGGYVAPVSAPDGTLWMSTANGIYYLNNEQKWEKSLDLRLATAQQQGGTYSPQIHLTDNGTLIAINGKEGLLLNDGKQWHKHPSYGSGRQYNDHFGHGFVEYPQGVFWLATNKGVRRIHNNSWYDLTVADGLPSNDVYSIEIDNSGNLWIGTTQGLVRFVIPSNPNPPAVEITQIDEDKIDSSDETDVDRVYVTGRSFVSVDWRGGDIETHPNRLQFQYSLDDQWSEPLGQKTATIGLRRGKNRFSIRAIDHHFNTSPVDSIIIIAKTEAPDPNINFPTSGEIVKGQVYIKGNIVDDDFVAYQVFITESGRSKIPNLEIEKPIFQAESTPRTTTLAVWNTEKFIDEDYAVWLLAQDEFEHNNHTKVVVRVDNTPPFVDISFPKQNQRVFKNISITAMVRDVHLMSYRIDFSTDPGGKSWEQIYLEAGLYQKNEDGVLSKTKSKTIPINKNWEIPVSEGSVWIRLIATDIAGNSNSQIVQVEIPAAVQTRSGGTISLNEQRVELYFPPNTLSQDTIVTVNDLTSPNIPDETPFPRITPVYEFAPASLKLNPIKPATLTLSYDPLQLSSGKQPVIFHRIDGPWEVVGGTANPIQQTISAAVLSLGQYAVVQTDLVQTSDSANLLSGSLICQPRVFSPKGNSFRTKTTISFVLDQPTDVSIKVYTVAGQLVNWLAEQRTFSSGKQSVHWGGRDSRGEILPTGLYIVSVTVGHQQQDKLVNIWNY